MAQSVYMVGSVNVDVTLPVEQLPPPGVTILAGDPVRSGGGKGANVAVAAARDGADIRLVAAVGDDEPGERSLAELRADAVDTTGVAVLPGRPTGLAMICVDPSGENFVVVAPGANSGLTPEHVVAGLRDMQAGDVCIVNFEIPEDAVETAGRLARERGARLLVNPSPVREFGAELLGGRPMLVANAGEVRALSGREGVADGAAELQARGCGTVVATLGADGAHVTTEAGAHTAVGAYPARPADTTGAGDTFTAVLAASIARGDDIVDAVRRAAAAAALSTERIGARAAMPRTADIERLIASG